MASLGNSLLDPWWEHHWIIKAELMVKDHFRYFFADFKFYFLSVSTLQDRRRQQNFKHLN